jgi:hypothetical protein
MSRQLLKSTTLPAKRYADQQGLLTYLQEHQLSFKEHFVKAWINNHRYYGVTTTSATEGLHSIVKR